MRGRAFEDGRGRCTAGNKFRSLKRTLRTKEMWPRDEEGGVAMFTKGLDLRGLLSETTSVLVRNDNLRTGK